MKTLMISMILVTAVWTGGRQQYKGYDGNPRVNCEYKVPGNGYTFWRSFSGLNCPPRVEVY